MNWLIFELGNRPEWRQKLRDEPVTPTTAEISPVRKPFSMQQNLKAHVKRSGITIH